eukprot:3321357-Prymnesium_polylepis.1
MARRAKGTARQPMLSLDREPAAHLDPVNASRAVLINERERRITHHPLLLARLSEFERQCPGDHELRSISELGVDLHERIPIGLCPTQVARARLRHQGRTRRETTRILTKIFEESHLTDELKRFKRCHGHTTLDDVHVAVERDEQLGERRALGEDSLRTVLLLDHMGLGEAHELPKLRASDAERLKGSLV